MGAGRISLPVKGNQLYANLKHINGIGGISQQPAYSLSQLRSLDNLIDRLKLLKGDKFKELSGDDKNNIQKMIEVYRQELYNSLHEPNGVYKVGFETAGLSLNLTV